MFIPTSLSRLTATLLISLGGAATLLCQTAAPTVPGTAPRFEDMLKIDVHPHRMDYHFYGGHGAVSYDGRTVEAFGLPRPVLDKFYHENARRLILRPLRQIAFASCLNTNSHPMLARTLETPFELFIFLGDNIYADTTNAAVMEAKYAALKGSAFYGGLERKASILATWDDHDYGWNDAGAEYGMKIESQRLFLDFLDEPAESPRRKREGIYDARLFGPPGQRVQVILLDTRYFRSLLSTGENNAVPSGGRYIAGKDPDATMLGTAQWEWLEAQLKVPAELRLIASSIQFISEFSGAEAWANLPHEKQRMLDLLKATRAGRVIFLSGDRHWAELSRLERPGEAPLYDLTSSALTQKHQRGTPTPNRYRDGPTYHDANLGLILLDWQAGRPAVTLQILDVEGGVRIEKRVF